MSRLKVFIFGIIFFLIYYHFCGKKQFEIPLQNHKTKKKIEHLNKISENLKKENEELKKKSEIEKIAREKYKLQKKDEKVIYFIEEESK